MNLFANVLTSLSLLFGFASIIFSLERQFSFACWAIILSVIYDGLDGQVARKNPVASEFGKELDSLVDVVSFGIAPSILGYIFIYGDFYFWATCALFIYLFCSVMRLARYNITSHEKVVNYFYGLPTTAAGGLIASFVLVFRRRDIFSPMPAYIPYAFLFLIVLLSLLMVSRIRYLDLDGLRKLCGRRVKAVAFWGIVLLIAAVFFNKAGILVFSLLLIYLLFSPIVVKRLGSQL